MTEAGSKEAVNSLKDHGIGCLYHVTDISNLHSIIENAGIYSFSELRSRGIEDPAHSMGNAVSRRKDGKLKLGETATLRDCVHLYLRRPDESMLVELKESGLLEEPYVLEVDPKVILKGLPWFRQDKDQDFELYNDYREFLDSVGQEVTPTAEVHIMNFIPYRYITNMPKSHTAMVSSQHPTAIIFLLDHSESMARSVDIGTKRYDYMSDALAEIVNDQLRKLVARCTEDDGTVNNRFDIAAIGYGRTAYSAWKGPLMGRGFVSMEELSKAKVDYSTDDYPWIDPRNDGTSSRGDEAMKMAYEMLKQWMESQENRYYYPPIVIHITDGDVSNESKRNFLLYAERIKALNTMDGNVLLWNINITKVKQSEMLLPAGDKIEAMVHSSLTLYEASSILPQIYSKQIKELTGEDNEIPHRAMGINVTFTSMSKLLEISTGAL